MHGEATNKKAQASNTPKHLEQVTAVETSDLRLPTSDLAWRLLGEVYDPEIPTLSILDLGIIRRVREEGGGVVVEMMPTFLGCPAIGMMREMIAERLAELGPLLVDLVLDEAWT